VLVAISPVGMGSPTSLFLKETPAIFPLSNPGIISIPLGFLLGRVMLPSLVLNTLLAAPIYLLVRVWLRGAGDLRVAGAR